MNAKVGLDFEKAVAAIQRQLDPGSIVSHDECIVDRLGHARQFDVVIRGAVGGHPMLGLAECKALNRRVTVEQVEAFVTKCADVNANLKLLVARNGFSRTALAKARHHGIQTLSLLRSSRAEKGVVIATRWFLDLYRWNQIQITPLLVDATLDFRGEADQITYQGARVLDWFTNYLVKNHADEKRLGWIVSIRCDFASAQVFNIRDRSFECNGFVFAAERICERKTKLVPWFGKGFYEWNSKRALLVPNSTVASDAVSMDPATWEDAQGQLDGDKFIELRMEAHNVQFETRSNAPDLDSL